MLDALTMPLCQKRCPHNVYRSNPRTSQSVWVYSVHVLLIHGEIVYCKFHQVEFHLCLKLTTLFLSTGELHLTPIHGALQLRPSFEYLNKGDANARQNASLTEEGILNLVFILIRWLKTALGNSCMSATVSCEQCDCHVI